MLSPYFIFVFGAEILFLARSATFSETPELMQKLDLRNGVSSNKIIKIEKRPVVHAVKLVGMCLLRTELWEA